MNVNAFFDVLLMGTCLAPGYYLVRTLHQIYNIEELSMLRYEWIPVLMAGIFFALWAVEGAYFDYIGDVNFQTSIIRDATLFASVSTFAFGTARFAETWGGFVKGVNSKKKLTLETPGTIPGLAEERT